MARLWIVGLLVVAAVAVALPAEEKPADSQVLAKQDQTKQQQSPQQNPSMIPDEGKSQMSSQQGRTDEHHDVQQLLQRNPNEPMDEQRRRVQRDLYSESSESFESDESKFKKRGWGYGGYGLGGYGRGYYTPDYYYGRSGRSFGDYGRFDDGYYRRPFGFYY